MPQSWFPGPNSIGIIEVIKTSQTPKRTAYIAPFEEGTPLDEETAGFQKRQKIDGKASLVVQWPRLQAPKAGGLALIPGQRTRSRMPQLRLGTAKSITQSYKEKKKTDEKPHLETSKQSSGDFCTALHLQA